MIQPSSSVLRYLPLPFAFALLVAPVACSSGSSDDDDPGDGATGGAAPGDGASGGAGQTGGAGNGDREPSGKACDKSERLGSFVVTLADTYTAFRGAISNGVAPSVVPEVLAESGSCQLLGAKNLFCSTPCANGELCAGDNQCIPAPTKVSAGVVTVKGLAKELAVNPNGITQDYSSNFDEPYPGFVPGSAIRVDAAGDVVGAFSLVGQGVGAISSSVELVELESGAGLELTWDAAGKTDESQVNVLLTVNAHGGTPAWIECHAEDTGTFTVPAEVVDALVELGLSGFPRVNLIRQSLDAVVVGEGCVDLSVNSELVLPVSIDGLVSCNNDDECPEGQSCSAFLVCE